MPSCCRKRFRTRCRPTLRAVPSRPRTRAASAPRECRLRGNTRRFLDLFACASE
jgi:hypothetical protein